MDAGELSSAERRVIQVLFADWQDWLRCTTIDQAMERVGLPFSHEARLGVAAFLGADPQAAQAMRWALPTYVLTNDEKLVARHLLRRCENGSKIPPPAVAAMDAQVPYETAEMAFEALSWLGVLVRQPVGWTLADDLQRFLGGLGFSFHEVVLPARSARFNTNCAPDFFIMTHRPTRERSLAQLRTGSLPELAGEGMSQKMLDAIRAVASAEAELAHGTFYEDERAILNDACGWSDTRIRVVMEQGALGEVTPESTWYLRGGG